MGNVTLLDFIHASFPVDALRAPTNTSRAFAWARVSTEMQEERGNSIEEQLREIHRYAEANGIEVVEDFHEAASAFQREEKRHEFHRMIAKAKASPGISVILVHDLSRFSRDSVRAKLLMRELLKSGIKVVSLNDPTFDPESVAGVYLEAITLAKNEAYSREVSFHTRKGCRANVQTRDPETGWFYKNGGQPLWGYRYERRILGSKRDHRPVIKSVWLLDESLAAGRPVHEWVRHCLVEMAAKGAALDELRDFCNNAGIPGRRKQYWSTSTWHALLKQSALLQYAGYGVWGVHRKDGRERPMSDWTIVPNAHPALITEEEAKRILTVRQHPATQKQANFGSNRSRSSRYLLSGGLFRCTCGSNMAGFRNGKRYYYVCGSKQYRGGRGCVKPATYVAQEQIEAETIKGLRNILSLCSDRAGFALKVNEELRRLWEESTGVDSRVEEKIATLDAKISRIRSAVEEGLDDVQWANQRLKGLLTEREKLSPATGGLPSPPQIDVETAMAYRRSAEKILAQGEPAERKRVLRACIEGITLNREQLEVEIQYRLPERIGVGMVAGGGFEPPTFGL